MPLFGFLGKKKEVRQDAGENHLVVTLSLCQTIIILSVDLICAGLIVGVGFKPTTNDPAQAGAKSGIIKKPPPPTSSSTSSKTNKENISSKKSEQAQQTQQAAPVTVNRSHQQTTPYQNSPAVPAYQQQINPPPAVVAVESSHSQNNSAVNRPSIKTDKNYLPQVESAQDRKKSDSSRPTTLSTSNLQTAVKLIIKLDTTIFI